jgi:hypothetical protein
LGDDYDQKYFFMEERQKVISHISTGVNLPLASIKYGVKNMSRRTAKTELFFSQIWQ